MKGTRSIRDIDYPVSVGTEQSLSRSGCITRQLALLRVRAQGVDHCLKPGVIARFFRQGGGARDWRSIAARVDTGRIEALVRKIMRKADRP
jgi:hypothetical protein